MVSRNFGRWWRHLTTGSFARRRAFPDDVLSAIETAVRHGEHAHPGEIRFALDTALSPSELWRGLSARERAEDAFAHLRVWDTAHNDGVLIYVLFADHAVEIVADRGVGDGRVPAEQWQACCRVMETHFAQGRFCEGAVAGVQAVAAVLARYPADRLDAGNELLDRPALL